MNRSKGKDEKEIDVEHKKAIAFLIAVLAPWSLLAGIFGTLHSPLMAPIARVVFPIFDVVFAYSLWWSYKNGGFEEL